MAEYLHGIETVEITSGTNSISEVRTAVIGIVGTAPVGPVNTPVLIQNAKDARQFGSFAEYGINSGYTLPYALSVIQDYGSGTIFAINVFEPEKLKPKADENDADEYYTVGEITSADIVGSVNASGVRTGMQAFLDIFNLYGFNPKILLAPGFSDVAAVRSGLLTIAEKVRAIVLADLPPNMTVTEAVTSRGPSGTFNTYSDRLYLLYPRLKHYDPATNQDQLIPFSATVAGLIAKTDRDYGYWFSPSNRELSGITGLERNITCSYTDPYCEIQLLNAKGITSIMNAYGTGYRVYGNRSAAYNDTGGLETFITSRRVSDMIAESLERSMVRYIDQPLTAAIVDDIVDTGNSFLRTLTSRGAIIGGSCYFSSEDNNIETISQGQITLIYEFTPPAALEHITNKIVLTNKYYNT
jgi:phage tail sheath protein FI